MLGAAWESGAGEQVPQFLTTPSFMARQTRIRGSAYFLCDFLRASIFLGQAWTEGKGELEICRHRGNS